MTRSEMIAGALGVIAAVAITSALVPARPNPTPEWAVATWRIEEIRGRPAVYDATMSIGPDGAYSGNTGCNLEFGPMLFAGESVRFKGAMTQRACAERPRMDQEARYVQAKYDARRARVDSSGQLLMLSETGEVLLRYSRIGDAPPWGQTPMIETVQSHTVFGKRASAMPQAPVWDGEDWRVQEIRGRVVAYKSTLSIRADGPATGETGCGAFSGVAVFSGENLRFTETGSSARDCNPASRGDQQDRYLRALVDARRAHVDSKGQILVFSENGETLFRLTRFIGRPISGRLAPTEAQPPIWDGALWRVETIRNRPVIFASTLSIYANGHVTGDTGCQTFKSGKATFSGQTLNFIATPGSATQCSPPERLDQEKRYIEALKDARSTRLDPDGQLLVLSGTEELLFIMTRVED